MFCMGHWIHLRKLKQNESFWNHHLQVYPHVFRHLHPLQNRRLIAGLLQQASLKNPDFQKYSYRTSWLCCSYHAILFAFGYFPHLSDFGADLYISCQLLPQRGQNHKKSSNRSGNKFHRTGISDQRKICFRLIQPTKGRFRDRFFKLFCHWHPNPNLDGIFICGLERALGSISGADQDSRILCSRDSFQSISLLDYICKYRLLDFRLRFSRQPVDLPSFNNFLWSDHDSQLPVYLWSDVERQHWNFYNDADVKCSFRLFY